MFKIAMIVMALSTTLFSNWFTNLFDSTPTPTITIPIDLSKAGTIVDMEFRVNYDESTYFSLDFSFITDKVDNDVDYKKVKKFLGINGYSYENDKKITVGDYARAKRELGNIVDKKYNLDGTIVPLRIVLSKMEDNATLSTFLDKTYNTRGENGGDTSSLYREFLNKYLEKGKYKLVVENLKSFKELKDRKINFRIQSTYRK